MHYTFDLWMARTHPKLPWCRYADDGLVHCRTEQEAEALQAELQARLAWPVTETMIAASLPRRVMPIRSPAAARSTNSESFCLASNNPTLRFSHPPPPINLD